MIEIFFHWLDIPSSEERKRAAYREKITECIDRAEKLKELIQQEKGITDVFILQMQKIEYMT
jgi:hypothetical protein